jgi:protein-L-isoaspartate(D-aspartate) O-methyltransferase
LAVALFIRPGQQPAFDRRAAEPAQVAVQSPTPAENPPEPPSQPQRTVWDEARERMVRQQMENRDIDSRRVLEAMRKVPRHLLVPRKLWGEAYADHPLPIGHDQTISQPYIVALMTQLASPEPQDRVLDVGTGSGYQAAVLAELVREVYSIEILKPLAESAAKRLKDLGYSNVEVRCGDGYRGWPEHAPFDVIIVAAAPDHVPQPLVDQLAPSGCLVIPVGTYWQSLRVIEKDASGKVREKNVASVAFVPMTGEAQKPGEAARESGTE